VKLLTKSLAEGAPGVVTKVHLNAKRPTAEEFLQVDTILFYADGGCGYFLQACDHIFTP
jgi:hypothetical protein